MEDNKGAHIGLGILIGVLLISAIIFLAAIIYFWGHPEEKYKPNYYLNSPEWTIDTIKTSSAHNGTTVEYKFIKKQD